MSIKKQMRDDILRYKDLFLKHRDFDNIIAAATIKGLYYAIGGEYKVNLPEQYTKLTRICQVFAKIALKLSDDNTRNINRINNEIESGLNGAYKAEIYFENNLQFIYIYNTLTRSIVNKTRLVGLIDNAIILKIMLTMLSLEIPSIGNNPKWIKVIENTYIKYLSEILNNRQLNAGR